MKKLVKVRARKSRLREGNKKELEKVQQTKKSLKEIAPTELRFPSLKYYHSLYWRKYGTYQQILSVRAKKVGLVFRLMKRYSILLTLICNHFKY